MAGVVITCLSLLFIILAAVVIKIRAVFSEFQLVDAGHLKCKRPLNIVMNPLENRRQNV